MSLPAGGPLPGAALSRLQGFVNELGAEPVVMDAAEHDRVMAYVSHLPQIVASGLMRTIGPRVGADGLAVSGQGLADSTRLASSPAGVWTEICQTNAAPLGAALDALIADLQQVRQQLAVPEQDDEVARIGRALAVGAAQCEWRNACCEWCTSKKDRVN